jgi:hypothetical protein
MTTWNKVQGDVDDIITVTLGGIVDLNDVASLEAHVWRRQSSATTLPATVADATARTIVVNLGSADGWLATATPHDWMIEYELTFADGSVLTWPDEKPDTIKVRAQGA